MMPYFIKNKTTLSSRDQTNVNIVVPLIEEGLDRRLISYNEPWFPHPETLPIRYTSSVEGLPAIVELGVPKSGPQLVSWALMPKDKPMFHVNAAPKDWPGEAWGFAMIDRRLGFSVDPLVFHSRAVALGLVSSLRSRVIEDVTMSIGWAA